MVKMMQDAGVEPVAIYPLSSSISDLSPLTTLEAAGFKPRATLIILNEGRADPTVPREQSFAGSCNIAPTGRRSIAVQSSFGCRAFSLRRRSRKGASPSRKLGTGLCPKVGRWCRWEFDRSSVHKWLNLMVTEFAPIASWLP
jgi:hypothetical protein